jgi:hypothetical protein
VPDEPQTPHPIATAMQWVSRITTVGLEMVLPGLGGLWLDGRWGTSFLGLVGFALGMTLGIWHLLQMTRSLNTKGGRSKQPLEKDSPS